MLPVLCTLDLKKHARNEDSVITAKSNSTIAAIVRMLHLPLRKLSTGDISQMFLPVEEQMHPKVHLSTKSDFRNQRCSFYHFLYWQNTFHSVLFLLNINTNYALKKKERRVFSLPQSVVYRAISAILKI